MATRLTATHASRHFSALLNRVRYQRETLVITRGDEPVAEIRPVPHQGLDLAGLFALLAAIESPDEGFAADLDAVQAAQGSPPGDPWAS